MIDEFARYGVEVVLIKSPQATTPEEQLLVQFRGMIAEYERAQIAERSRRGKKYRAKAGSINVLPGAPYGYRYIRKTDTSAAYYEIEEIEASTVRKIFDLYTKDFLSIGAIAKKITSEGIPTKTGKSVWDRSVIWAMLKNPAYKGTACYGKTEVAQRKKVTRLSRKRGGFSPRCSSTKELPMKDWIEIPVAAIISEETFEIAQERLQKNKALSRRRTIEPTLLQGVLVCRLCGYAYYRTSTRTSKRKIYYYRCLGSDDYRYTNGRVCENQPIRQDYLDEVIYCVGGVISPLLANIFMHHALDEWMKRHFPYVKFERFADDGLLHCQSLRQAEKVLEAIKDRLKECGLELHPEKTKIVYCKDGKRKLKYSNHSFDFLGYTFRPRKSRNRYGRIFLNFTPAVSNKAKSKIMEEIKSWKLHRKTNLSLIEIAKKISVVRLEICL